MAFWDRETGELTFSDGLRLSSGLAMDEVAERLEGRQEGVVRLQSHAVTGGRLIPICMVEGGAVQSISLIVGSIAGKEPASAARERAFLASRLGLQDPDPKGTLYVLCPFGDLLLWQDPHTGRCEARLSFTAR